MQRRLLTGLLFLALGGVLIWLWQAGGNGESSASAPTDRESAVAGEPEPARFGAEDPKPVEGAIERTDAARTASEPDGSEEWLTIRTLRFGTRAPVPDAEVIILWQEGGLLMPIYSSLKRRDLEAGFREVGTVLRSDGEGMLRISRTGSVAEGIARAGALFGRGSWFAQHSTEPVMEILLDTDRGFEAIVVDESGAPVPEVPVALFRPRDWQPQMGKLTDSQGRARFLHLQSEYQHEGDIPDLDLGFAFPLADGPRVTIRWQEPPTEPVSLVLPPTGSLVVTAIGADGKAPPRASVHTQRRVAPDERFGTEVQFLPRMSLGHAQSPIDEHGVAEFPWIGLGLQLDVAGRFQPGANLWTSISVAGPTRAGETIAAELRVPALDVVLVFRLVQPNALPTEGHPYQGVVLWLDADGKALAAEHLGSTSFDETRRITLPREEPQAWVRREYHVWRQMEAGGSTFTARLDLSAPLTPGEHDLGEILLSEPPLIAAGIVVDEAGAPIANATVTATTSDPPQPRLHPFLPTLYPSETAEDGRFRIVGVLEGAGAMLRARHPLFLEETAPLVSGADGHRIVMKRGCALSGRVVLGEGLSVREFQYTVRVNERRIAGKSDGRFAADGGFEIGGLPPGAASFELLHANAAVWRVPDLLLAPGAPPEPRLNPLDLRGKLQLLRIRVLGEDGSPLQHAEARVLGAESLRQEWQSIWNGEASIVCPTDALSLGVRAEGYLAQLLENPRGELTVRMQQAIETEIVLADPEIIRRYPGAGATLRWMSPLSQVLTSDGGVRFDAQGRARLKLRGNGEFRICLTVPVHDGSDNLLVHGADPSLWPLLSNPIGATPARFVLPGSVAEVAQALARMPDDE